MPMYPDLISKLKAAAKKIPDFYYSWASSPFGFLWLALSIRFIVLLVITINFGYLFQQATTSSLKIPTSLILWGYFVFIIYLLFLSILKHDQFEGRSVQVLQIIIDGAIVAFVYWVSINLRRQPDSNIFIFYFLPLMVAARFLDIEYVFLLMGSIFITSLTCWFLELEPAQFLNLQYWFANLLPQLGFLFVLTIFYLIYYRRRKMSDRLQTLALNLEDQYARLWRGWFSVDSELKITSMDASMQQRHAPLQAETTCFQLFCQEDKGDGHCPTCPIAMVVQGGTPPANSRVMFTDRNGTKYPAQITASPIMDGSHKLIGVSAWVHDLDEYQLFHQRQKMLTEDLERVIDQNRSTDRAHVLSLTKNLEAISQASETVLSSDIFRGVDEIVRAMVLLLGCRVATVRQYQVDEERDQEGLVLYNQFGLDAKIAERISFLDLNSTSLVVKTFKTGDFQYVEDLQKPGLLEFEELPKLYDLHSIACFPLKDQGKVIGTFTLFRNRSQGFSDVDLQLGRALSNIMATLVSNQRQFMKDQMESERRKRELEILNTISQRIATIHDPWLLAQLVADTVRTEVHAETAAIFLKQDDILFRSAISGIEPEWFKDETYHIGEGLTGRAAQPEPHQLFGKRLVENKVEHSNLVIPENLLRYSQKLPTGRVQHLLAVPLNGLEGTFGVLRTVNKMDGKGKLDRQGFSEQDAELMTTIACIVAVAMENARSFETEKKKLRIEHALRRSVRNLTSTLEEEKILDTILENLRKVVNYDTASLFLREPDGLRLKSMSGFSEKVARELRNICLDPQINYPFQMMQENFLPILRRDLQTEHLLEPIIGTEQIRSWIGVPLIIKEQLVGWLSVDGWSPNQFNREDMLVAQDFAQQASIAIDNAKQYKLQTEQLGILMDLEKELIDITSATDKNATMNKVAEAASQLMKCEMAGVALYEKDKKEIRAVSGVGYVGIPDEYARNFSFQLSHRGGDVIREKRVFCSKDASRDSESIFGHRLIDPIGAKGVIAAPLSVGDYTLGVLYAASHSPKEWTESQRTFFSILSNHAAIAIRNSQLMDVKERRAQLLDLFHNLSNAGQLTNDPDVIYNILLTAVTAEYGLRFNRALLFLYDKKSNLLKGFTGIGQLEKSEAHSIWESLDERSHSFESYIQETLSKDFINYTAMHYKAKNLAIPIRVETNDVLSRIFKSRKQEIVYPENEPGRLDNEFYRIFDTNPFVVVPLLVNQEVVGMLVVDNKITGDPIQPTELDLLKPCGSQLAAAIYRNNLHQQVQERINIMEQLQDLTRVFSELGESREVLQHIADAAKDLLHADIVYLVPYDQEKDALIVNEAVITGIQTSYQHEKTFSTHGLTSLAKNEPGGLVTIEDLKSKRELRSHFAEQEGVQSVAVCRLELRKKTVGMLYINYCSKHWFSEVELNTLRMLAGQASVVINNATLFKSNEILATQRERNRLREDLHDVLNTFAFKVMEPAESIFDKEKAKRRKDLELVEEARQLWRFSRHTYQQLERILEDMREPVLVERGLAEAIKILISNSKLPGVNFTLRGDVRPSADVELALYRICQEAISNIHKHACLPKNGDGLCNIILELNADQSRLFVQDFGMGFSMNNADDRKNRIGLQAMRNWARKIGTQIDIQSAPSCGTSLNVVVPRIEREMEP